jgi:hypothetical protein
MLRIGCANQRVGSEIQTLAPMARIIGTSFCLGCAFRQLSQIVGNSHLKLRLGNHLADIGAGFGLEANSQLGAGARGVYPKSTIGREQKLRIKNERIEW